LEPRRRPVVPVKHADRYRNERAHAITIASSKPVEVPQLERLRLRDTLDEICIANRQFQAKAATARDDSAPTM
jgi:hypothetical protein